MQMSVECSLALRCNGRLPKVERKSVVKTTLGRTPPPCQPDVAPTAPWGPALTAPKVGPFDARGHGQSNGGTGALFRAGLGPVWALRPDAVALFSHSHIPSLPG